jgi:hypothetical protein
VRGIHIYRQMARESGHCPCIAFCSFRIRCQFRDFGEDDAILVARAKNMVDFTTISIFPLHKTLFFKYSSCDAMLRYAGTHE